MAFDAIIGLKKKRTPVALCAISCTLGGRCKIITNLGELITAGNNFSILLEISFCQSKLNDKAKSETNLYPLPGYVRILFEMLFLDYTENWLSDRQTYRPGLSDIAQNPP